MYGVMIGWIEARVKAIEGEETRSRRCSSRSTRCRERSSMGEAVNVRRADPLGSRSPCVAADA